MQETHMTSFQLFEVLNLIFFIYFDMIFILFTENDSIYDKKNNSIFIYHDFKCTVFINFETVLH